MRHCRDPC